MFVSIKASENFETKEKACQPIYYETNAVNEESETHALGAIQLAPGG